MKPGRLLASGRDADIFEYGPRSVLRRSRVSRSLALEARTMEHLASHGYPVPAVEELSDDGCGLVMERIDGRSMVESLSRAPWTLLRSADMLGTLHRRLHEIPAPKFLPPAPVGEGSSLLHLDLHPLNVMITRAGPVVIDWTNACIGDPDTDVALAWLLMSAGELPDAGVRHRVLGFGRTVLTNRFLAQFDRVAITRQLRPLATWKTTDSHLTDREIAGVWRAVERGERSN
jgi:aminoglycoside phosphotransferase (APT) family kinase protein